MDRRAFLASTAWLLLAPFPGDPPLGPSPPGAAGASDAAFEAWKQDFIRRSGELGLSEGDVRAVLEPVTANPDVVALDRRQPEFSRPISGYIATAAGPGRVDAGLSHLQDARPWLDPIAASYRTGPEILVAIWSIETDFGRVQGSDDVIQSMATLAAEGRRRSFAESELVGALKILFSGDAARETLKGSWAGAMGQTQFTPLDYLAYAVDANGDGRRDIWNSAPDALASTANFLVKKADWVPGGSPQVEAVLPKSGFDYALLEGPTKTPDTWASFGVTPAPGRYLRPVDRASGASLIAPMGWRGPAFFAFPNHNAIKTYNNSTSYALAVGLLAAGLAGAPGLVTPWPEDQPISLDDRIAAQDALRRLGFYDGPTDGLFGQDTRKAARLWQASAGLPADGYLSFDLVQRLKAQVPPAPAAA